jgi:hypothetical protein
MTRHVVVSAATAICCIVGLPLVSSAQSSPTASPIQRRALDAMTVRGAPYSADAVTTVTQILGDGTKVQRSVTAKVYRDSAGRTRREETVIGLASLRPAADGFHTIAITDPVAGTAYNLYPQNRTALQLLPLTQLMATRGRPSGLAAPLAGGVRQGGPVVRGSRSGSASAGSEEGPALRYEPLGTREMNGLMVKGQRTTQTIAVGAVGNDKPIVITTDTWESPKLRVLMSSRHTDPRTGVVDYQLTKIQQIEPGADLFVVPPGYMILSSSPGRPTK